MEDNRTRIEKLGSSIMDNQFILHALNSMTQDYDSKLAIIKERVRDKSNPITVDKICDNLNLRFKRFIEKQNEKVKITRLKF
jgi:hypothetical protein